MNNHSFMNDQQFSSSQDQEITMTIKKVIVEILTIVGHSSQEADEHAEFMMTKISEWGLALLLMRRGEEERKRILESLKQQTDQQQMVKILETYFSSREVNEALQEATKQLFKQYFTQIKKRLTTEQQLQINQLISNLPKE